VIQKIEDIELLNQFNKQNNIPTFLQTSEYYKFLQSINVQVGLIGELRSGTLVSCCIYSIVNARRGKALQVIHGPIIMDNNVITYRQYLDFLKNLAKLNKCDFIRINPFAEKDENLDLTFKTNGFLPTPFENVFSITNRIDLSKIKNKNILESFNPVLKEKIKDLLLLENTMKDGKPVLRIEYTPTLEEDCRFLTDQQESEQQTFDSIMAITNHFASLNKSIVAKIYYNNKLSAYQTFVINNKYICNHHGAGLKDKVDFNSYTHYKTLQKALDMGITTYDFWGLCDPQDNKHPWSSPSKAKRYFGGEDYYYLQGYDFPLTPKYWLTNLYEKCQKIKRGH
jgi:lipid II:glycine glycyltransferase (peptidoglycan interpeptide bridge formation enzyme)